MARTSFQDLISVLAERARYERRLHRGRKTFVVRYDHADRKRRVTIGPASPERIPVPEVLVGEAVPFALAFVCAAAGSAFIHWITGGRAKTASAG